MEALFEHYVQQLSSPFLAVLIVVTMAVLVRGADFLVHEAVILSHRSGIPKVVIGATVVSLGTTAPEAVVSVLAAFQGKPELALGNAVGSIICDTGLILGLACLISPLPLDKRIVNRQGWIQFGSGFLLVLACIPWSNLPGIFTSGGNLSRSTGFVFLFLLALYMWKSIRWSRRESQSTGSELAGLEINLDSDTGLLRVIMKLLLGISMVVGASWLLIPSASEAAVRLSVPESIIAATIVAFGTSLPELVTAITATLKNHGELAVGNVIGADILNVLFVAGASASVTAGGLAATAPFFTLYFPSMLLVLVVFRIGIFTSGERLKRGFGAVMLATYIVVTVASYVVGK
jgi:cation:H+ antiporter